MDASRAWTSILIVFTLTALTWLAGCASAPADAEAAETPEQQTVSSGPHETTITRCTQNGRPCDGPTAATAFTANAAQPFEWPIQFNGGRLRIDLQIDQGQFAGFAIDGAECRNTASWVMLGGGTTQIDCGTISAGRVELTVRPGGLAEGTLTIKGATSLL